MKHVALVAATEMEINPTIRYLKERLYLDKKISIEIIITGAGLLQSTYVLTRKFLENKPSLAIQAGIAGSFHPLYPPGSLVTVKSEIVGDAGVMEKEGWKDLFDLNLSEENVFPYTNKWMPNPHEALLKSTNLKAVKSITVNEISTQDQQIKTMMEKYTPITETMEGAAFHFVCLSEKIPFVQLRAVSNWVGERNKDNWKMPEAIEQLNQHLIQFINHVSF